MDDETIGQDVLGVVLHQTSEDMDVAQGFIETKARAIREKMDKGIDLDMVEKGFLKAILDLLSVSPGEGMVKSIWYQLMNRARETAEYEVC